MSESSKSRLDEYDPITDYHHLKFQNRCLRGSGDDFQQLFEDIMVRARPGEFERVRPYGKFGDRKCDGLIQAEGTIFQVYSPDELKQSEVQKKIDKDLDGAVQSWSDLLKKWVFVYNVKRGTPPDIQVTLQQKRKQYPDIEIDGWSNDYLWEIARGLSLQQRAEIFGAPPLLPIIANHSEPTFLKRTAQLDDAMQWSKAHCIESWIYAGVNESDAISLTDDPSIGLPPPELQLSPGKLIILTGAMGSGKSLIGERLFQSAIQKTKEDDNAPIPVHLEARKIGNYSSLRHALEEATRGLCDPASQRIFAIIDSVDRIGITNALDLLKEARMLVRVRQQTTILLISRSIPEFSNAPEAINAPLLSREESEALVKRLSGRNYFSLQGLSKAVQDAILQPLFAVLLSTHLRKRSASIPESKEQLLRSLVELYLEPLREHASKISNLLEQLAATCIDGGGATVPLAAIPSWSEQQQLLQSWLVVKDADSLRFPLPILVQWFASQRLASDSSLVKTLTTDRQRLELWQYPLVIAVATFSPNRVPELLTPIAESQPALAANIVSEAIAFQDRSGIPSVSAIELGQQVRDAMQAWISGFKPFAPVLPFVREDGILPSLGVRLSKRVLEASSPSSTPITTDWVEIAWHSNNEHPPVDELPPGRDDSEYLWSLGWKSVQGFLPYSHVSWAWKWTLHQVVSSMVKQVAIPIEAGYLSLEAAWFGAVYITERPRNYSYPIPLRQIESILYRIEDSRFPPVIQHCLRQLRIEVEAAHVREQTHLCLPDSFIAFRNNQTISHETLVNYAVEVYLGAFEGYQQLVKVLSPKFLPDLPLASILPARLVGVVVPPSSSSGSVTWSWYWEPLPEGSQNELKFKLSNQPLSEDNPAVQTALEKIQSLNPKWWRDFSLKTKFASPISRFWLGTNPVTKLAYQWLWNDLKRVAWVSGELDSSEVAYWHPVKQTYRSGMD
jgi:hypothetical protein